MFRQSRIQLSLTLLDAIKHHSPSNWYSPLHNLHIFLQEDFQSWLLLMDRYNPNDVHLIIIITPFNFRSTTDITLILLFHKLQNILPYNITNNNFSNIRIPIFTYFHNNNIFIININNKHIIKQYLLNDNNLLILLLYVCIIKKVFNSKRII